MTNDLPIHVRQPFLRELAQTPMPEVSDKFLVAYNNGLTLHEEAWRESAEQAALILHRSLQHSETAGRQRLAEWEQESADYRPRQRPRVVANHLTEEEITQELLAVMTSPWSFQDVTGVECALSSARVNRIDLNGDYVLGNCRIVYSGVAGFRGDAPHDRFLIEALKRWKGLRFSSLLKENVMSLNANQQAS